MKKSPNGQYQAHYYLSGNDGVGEAPYGDHIVLSSANVFPWNNQEETVFAGYCKRDIEYEWEGNKRIVVWCEGETRYKVLSSQGFGIGVDIFNHKRQ